MKEELSGAIMNRHLAPFADIQIIAKALVHELINSEAPIQQNSRLSVLVGAKSGEARVSSHRQFYLSEYNVFFIQRGRTPYQSGLFSKASHVKRYSPLSLDFIQDNI
jgi:hypothetical protein